MDNLTLQREPLLASNNFLQTDFWAYFKENFGWKPHSFRLQIDHQDPIFFLVLTRKLAPLSTLAYIPYPNFETIKQDDLPIALKQIAKLLKKHIPHLFVVRWDLNIEKSPDLVTQMHRYLKPLSHISIQPPDTTILNLHPSLDELLQNMHKKTRYNIRLAEKKGVTIEFAPIHDVVKWYELYKETAKRDGINIHSLAYYQKFFTISHLHHYYPQAHLLLAYHEGDLLAGMILLLTDTHATYVYGASSNHKRNLMPSYALQWQAIQFAKARGCSYYDFFGIPPQPDPHHPMFGLYQFKIGFGGSIHHYLGLWDAPTKKIHYTLYSFAEKIRSLLNYLKKKWKK